MRSAFFGFHVASTALFTSRAKMNVTSHNLANAEIAGFSRQAAVAQANTPLWLNDQRGMYGTGSQVTGIIQIRDRFLDTKFWGQRAIEGRFTAVNTNLHFIETVFNQVPEDAGVLRTFNNFFASLQNLSDSAGNATFRTSVITEAASLAEAIRHNAAALQRHQADVNREIADVVNIINSLGVQITNLNRQIQMFERDGSNANDLRDQRALLIDELSRYVNIQVDEIEFAPPGQPSDRRTTIMINGIDFIAHDMVNRLQTVPRSTYNPPPLRNEMDAPGLYDIRFANGQPFNIYSPTLGGQLRGLIDVRDGNHDTPTLFYPAGHPNAGNPIETTRFKGIPFYMNQLNSLVRTFSRAMNEGRNALGDSMVGIDGQPLTGHIHAFDNDGLNRRLMMFTFRDADGNTMNTAQLDRWILAGANGQPLRNPDGTVQTVAVERDAATGEIINIPANVYRDIDGNAVFTLDYSGMNALNFEVHEDLVRYWQRFAASSNPATGASANDVILGFNQIAQNRSLFREGRLSDFVIATSNHLAVDNQQARDFRHSYGEITTQTQNFRLSVKGVDTNEEMMSLVRFQSMFIAASRLVNVMDTVYDTLINRLGSF